MDFEGENHKGFFGPDSVARTGEEGKGAERWD